MYRYYLIGIICFLSFSSGFGQSIWTNAINDGNPSAFNPFTLGQTVSANLTVSGIGRGSGITGNAGSNRYNAASWSTPQDANDYFYFTLTPLAGFTLNLTSFVYTGQSSGTGPNTFALRSSLDNYAASIGSVNANGATVSLSASQFQGLTGAITFRFYGWGGTASAGTFSINDFTFNGSLNSAPLGLNLLAFSGINTRNGIQLNWISADEVNFSHFEIERSVDGKNFVYYDQKESMPGNSDQKLYSIIDAAPFTVNNYYRLKLVDNDASYTYSKVIFIKNEEAIKITFNNDSKILLFNGLTESKYCLIYDVNGRLLHRLFIENTSTLDVSNLSTGTYIAVLENNGERITTKFFINK